MLSIFLIAGYFYVGNTRLDPDFGWHLRAGQHMLVYGVPKIDIFTYTAEYFPWVNHSWLSDLLVAGLYMIGGYSIVAVFFALVWTSALLIASRSKYYIVTILAFIATVPFAGIRMVAWSVLFLAILERLLENSKRHYIWLLPLLFLGWANLHGSFTLGLLVLVLHQIFSKSKLPWQVVLLSFIATLVNPFGYGVYVEVARTALDTQLKSHITEWQAINLPTMVLPYLIGLISLHFIFNKHPIKTIASIPGLLLLLALSSIRHAPLFVVSSQRYFEDYTSRLTTAIKSMPKNNMSKKHITILVIICLFMAGLTVWQLLAGTIVDGRRDRSYPVAAVEYLANSPCQGRIFNDYNYGGYIIWKLPDSKVYIDGRMPSWSENNVNYFDNYDRVLKDKEFRTREFERYSIKCVIIRNDLDKKDINIIKDLQEAGWEAVDLPYDKYSTLLIRKS
ncbi:MAG: hypothetical protein QG675_69 [Patescibacteria group bacterium]|nr:hypothetical protein [Patescibacteria group bacterium]